ncbi:glycosyl hydrolase family 18 protein [Yersinia enterocolitica]|uniref:glycosyl hydrolase family 18 protein n=1 Tax=Yersinia enterocolitica TaxID=630 RepID=UPI0029A2C808|nr:chitinase [Yersinia enterocolitica]
MSLLIKYDEATEKSYSLDGFSAKKESVKFSYTSARVAKSVYNKYNVKGRAKVIGYYTDWSQYDGRLDNDQQQNSRGSGVDLALVDPLAYDKLIIGFCGILGDKGDKYQQINQQSPLFGRSYPGEVSFIDAWGDCQSYRNCGFPAYQHIPMPQGFNQLKAMGVLGGLRELQKKALEQGHELALSFSIGGWTMSNAFHDMVRDIHLRQVFCHSVVDIFTRFPMFSEVDIDWEYPGAAGNNNPFDENDGNYYVILIKELKDMLVASNLKNVKISIACSAIPAIMAKSNIPELISAGLYGLNVMTYDFFGTPWAKLIAHHTNLHSTIETSYSVESAVDYLLAQGVPAESINIGYAGYSRNAKMTKLNTLSPLSGNYEPSDSSTTGTFESGTTEWYDIINNYLDLENKKGKNGFNLYTDEVADADYLYNPDSSLFLSIDTPRTVKAKAEFVKNKKLGGIFTWTADQDQGLLVNAAREGLDCPIIEQHIDMSHFYFKGINVTPSPVEVIKAVITGPTAAIIGEKVTLSGENSSSSVSGSLQFTWISPESVNPDAKDKSVISFIIPSVNSSPEKLQFTLSVTDGVDHATTSHSISIVNHSGYPEWQKDTNYIVSDRVSWKGDNWEAKWWTRGTEPGTAEITDAYPWKKIT